MGLKLEMVMLWVIKTSTNCAIESLIMGGKKKKKKLYMIMYAKQNVKKILNAKFHPWMILKPS
jgi:hypothetical protein